MRSRRLILIYIVILCSLTTCGLDTSAILGDGSCEPPCWKGIVVGKSTINEVENIISNLPGVQSVSAPQKILARNPYLEEQIFWSFDNKNDTGGEIYFRNSISTLLSINVNNNISLSIIIEKFGEPKDIFIQSSVGDPAVFLTVDILYPEKGICLSHQPSILFPFENPETYRIKSSTPIRKIVFIDPLIPNGQLTTGCLYGLDEETYNENKQDWKGYGMYDVLGW